MQSSKPKLTIDLNIIKSNYETLKRLCLKTDVGASVKADSYGLGVHKVAPILYECGCKYFFVANCDEGVYLRSILGNHVSIFVFHGVFQSEINAFTEYNLIPVLNHLAQIEIWQNHANIIQKKLPCLIHIDTGMNRLGMQEDEVKILDLEKHTRNLDILYVISHLSSAEDKLSKHNKVQFEKFTELSNKFSKVKKSLANSSGIFLGKHYHFDLTRPGAAIYGLNSAPYMKDTGIKPVVSLSAPIIQISMLKHGKSVGYNATYTNMQNKNCKIATIPVGYADGYLRALSNKGVVKIDGYSAPIIGRISMDLTVIDISHIPDNLVYLGKKVELLGQHITADDIAKLCSTNGYEILTSLGSRYERRYT